MSDKRIHDSLNLCFHRHRLVFWYDPSGEWTKSFESFENQSVEKIVVGENEFAPKVRILGEAGGNGRFQICLHSAMRYLRKPESRIGHLTQVEATATKEKTAARKEREKLRKALKDLPGPGTRTMLPLAQQRLEIDLDDGVKVNYLKFEGAVAPIAGSAANED